MARSFSSNLKGKVRNFPLPKDRPLVPLYEAIVNSINAIDERRNKGDIFSGLIEIEVFRDNTFFLSPDETMVIGFRIIDNGIGFDEANMKSFMEADSDYKLDIGGKGVGRFSWLKAFSNASIKSTYKVDDSYVTREFVFTVNNTEIEDIVTDSDNEEYRTEVCLNSYIKDYGKNVPKQLDTIAARIIHHCFAYFLRTDCPSIYIFDKDNRIHLNKRFTDIVKTDANKMEFFVGNQLFQLLNIKITDRFFSERNRLFLCANERLVYSRELEKTIVNLDSDIFKREGFWYIGILTSDYLDNNVDMNRLSFDISAESSPLFPENPGLDEIERATREKICEFLNDYLSRIETEKQERINHYTTEIAPQYRHLTHYVPEKIRALKPGISDKELDDSLYAIKREFENKTKAECKDLLKKLDEGIISSDEYQLLFQDTIEKVSDVNRAALADYVIHRRIILDLFDKGLKMLDDGKFNLEKYIHQLIYPMRTTSDELPYENHNLWLLDEKLSFCHFISSDKPFNNSNNDSRTDIMFLDSPIVVADDRNVGIAFNSIMIIELKRPMRNDYTMSDNPITQLIDYVKKIKNGGVKDSRGREIHVTENTQFFLYALCDITSSLDSIIESMNYTKTSDGLGAYYYHSNLHAYIEVMSFDKVRNDSEKRNRILFEKLGIE